MKNFLFKLSIVFMLSFGAYAIITSTENKQAEAVCGCVPGCINPSLCMCPQDAETTQSVANFASSAASKVKNMLEKSKEFIDNFTKTKQIEADETHETVTTFAAEQLSKDGENTRQSAQKENAIQNIKKKALFEENQYQDVLETPAPSREVCFHTTVRIEQARAEADEEHNRNIEYEKKRRLRNSTPPIILDTALLETVNNNPDILAQDMAMETCDGCTLSQEEERSLDIVSAIEGRNINNQPLSQTALEDNPELYIEDTIDTAKYNLSNAVDAKIKSKKIAPNSSNCQQAQELVYSVSQSVYGDPHIKLPPNTCPSAATLEWAEIQKLKNPEDMTASLTGMEGNLNSQRLHLSTMELFMMYEQNQLLRSEILRDSALALQ